MNLNPNFCPIDFNEVYGSTDNLPLFLVKASRQDSNDDEHSEYFFIRAPHEHRLAFFLAHMFKSHVDNALLTLENLAEENYQNIPELEELMSSYGVIDGVGVDTLFDFRVKELTLDKALELVEFIEINPLNTDIVGSLFLEAL